jgi:hypothetical protein
MLFRIPTSWLLLAYLLAASCFAVGSPLQVWVVPHSHCDVGWTSTMLEYFEKEVQFILDTVVAGIDFLLFVSHSECLV